MQLFKAESYSIFVIGDQYYFIYILFFEGNVEKI